LLSGRRLPISRIHSPMSATVTPADHRRTRQRGCRSRCRREQVLDATLKLIVERGYARASMEAVAREVDAGQARVYSAYPGAGRCCAPARARGAAGGGTLAEGCPSSPTRPDFAETLTGAASELLRAVAETRTPGSADAAGDETPAGGPGARVAGPPVRPGAAAARCSPGAPPGAPSWSTWTWSLAARALLAVGEQASGSC